MYGMLTYICLIFTVNVGKYTIHGLFETWKMGDNPACYVYQKVGFNSLCFTVKVGIVETHFSTDNCGRKSNMSPSKKNSCIHRLCKKSHVDEHS